MLKHWREAAPEKDACNATGFEHTSAADSATQLSLLCRQTAYQRHQFACCVRSASGALNKWVMLESRQQWHSRDEYREEACSGRLSKKAVEQVTSVL